MRSPQSGPPVTQPLDTIFLPAAAAATARPITGSIPHPPGPDTAVMAKPTSTAASIGGADAPSTRFGSARLSRKRCQTIHVPSTGRTSVTVTLHSVPRREFPRPRILRKPVATGSAPSQTRIRRGPHPPGQPRRSENLALGQGVFTHNLTRIAAPTA